MAVAAGGGSNPLATEPQPVLTLAPIPEDVHRLLPHRPMWTTTSKPSLADVQEFIDRLARGLAAEFPTVPPDLGPTVVAYLEYSAAALVEQSYNPEQQFGDNAPAPLLDQRAGAELLRLRNAMKLRRTSLSVGTVALGVWC